MKTGIPEEIMQGEGRVALIPANCQALTEAGHHLCIQAGAGNNSGYADADYEKVGVEVLESAKALYENCQLIVKVKQPLAGDLEHLTKDHVVFSYLHLAADIPLIEELCRIGLTAIPFEAVTDNKGDHPLLAPMSSVAGRLSIIRGARLLFSNFGGRGVLLGGVDGADVGRVVVLGAGVAGTHAMTTALGLEAEVHIFDLKEARLQSIQQQFPDVITHISTPEAVADVCREADLVIGAVMLPGRRAPIVLTSQMKADMPDGSVIVDIAIDQGGCVENIRPTASDELVYIEHGIIHSAVPNMPGAVPRTSSQALSAAITPYVKRLLEAGYDKDADLKAAIAVSEGSVVDPILIEEMAKIG